MLNKVRNIEGKQKMKGYKIIKEKNYTITYGA
jgi:hypothetical protein